MSLDSVIRRRARHALACLAPAFKASRLPPIAIFPADGDGGSYRHILPETQQKASEAYHAQTGRWPPPAPEHAIEIGQDAEPDVYGEEAGHFLHAVVNPAFDALVKRVPHAQMTEGAALGLARRLAWSECIGRYAGLAYARHCRSVPRTAEEERQRFEQNIQELEKMMQGSDQHTAYKLSMRRDELNLSMLVHHTGYSAADELFGKDTAGRRLAALARLDADGALDFARLLPAWNRAWDAMYGRHGGRLHEYARLFYTRKD